MTDPIRLAKHLAKSIPCSRREAELYIVGGWVTVDGQVVEEPQFKVSQQKIELHPEANLDPIESVTILFHQPTATDIHVADTQPLISAANHATNDYSGIRLIKQHFSRLSPCTPLERNAGGLVVFTQDGRVTRKLTEDAATIEQEYVVEVSGELSNYGLEQLNHGIKFNGQPLPPIKVSWQNETRLRFALKGITPGQIAHMCLTVGLTLISMKRIRIGRVAMSKLQPGLWRYLKPMERF